MSKLKEALYQQCIDYVQMRMAAAQQGIDEAQQAAKDDTKSSAGDKYETGREMAQQETNRNMAQLTEANKLKIALNSIPTSGVTHWVENGSVVKTNNGNFYLAISAGLLTVSGDNYFAISPASPIGLKMKGLQVNDEFNLNGKLYKVESIL
ncbi:3-oxoacyl-ACP synthase [Mucilaginibacter sp. S1162]|uniref:3-oxoacyl-ACP synthase n=1 Tax=Mucilaginibacter humi TaxID=2732510 RepID=A0ABX1W282_9SPHI|nr:3-oxoacyl-ACP synthase [Mucilaginibacter humi]NNU33319.1 3-oxoacyl-ACP synthase [Mucilaginibacter humi]